MHFSEGSKKGVPQSHYNLGIYYQSGIDEGYLPRDLKKATKLFTLACKEGDKLALSALAACYTDGQGVEKNDTIAAKLKVLSKLDIPMAAKQFNMLFPETTIQQSAHIQEKKQEKPAQKLKMTNEQYVKQFLKGFGEQYTKHLFSQSFQRIQSVLFETPIKGQTLWSILVQEQKTWSLLLTVQRDQQSNEKLKQILDTRSDVLFCFSGLHLLHNFIKENICHTFDYTPEWYRNVFFETSIGNNKVLWEMLSKEQLDILESILTSKDHPEYLDKFIADTTGFPKAEKLTLNFMLTLGFKYELGYNSIPQNPERAVQLYTIVIARGDTRAYGHLGNCYLQGLRIKQNINEAVQLYRLGCEQNDVMCQYKLGLAYQAGHAGETNMEKSFELLTLASRQGHSEAIVALKECYELGVGTPKNLNKAKSLHDLLALKPNPIELAKRFNELFPEPQNPPVQFSVNTLGQASDAKDESQKVPTVTIHSKAKTG